MNNPSKGQMTTQPQGRFTDTGFRELDLFNIVMRGNAIDAQGCTLQRVGDRFLMSGATGQHSLAVTATNELRLWAHWQGFKQNNACHTQRALSTLLLSALARVHRA
jgi:hypothetical protein